ncbi:MAG: hypothetical protein HUJ77_14055 [Clostridium sp.]|uniref:hypothetical protein n=1 Tax=Clostridium sp. TaxID=1506 RepID=UPI0025B8BA49|nr:hypothetical protein [Clostridium sp.]MCF0149503.1 hypothetical protein [Clostridium sp.]
MKVGDKVKITRMEERVKRVKAGRIAVITNSFIVVQFKNYRESFKKTDLLAEGWVDMQLWNGREWIKVDKEVIK